MGALNREARRIRDVAQLSDAQIAHVTGVRPRTVRDWLADRSSPTGKRAERLIELSEMTDRLARVMTTESIAIWLQRPALDLGDEKPIELLARGEYHPVAELISKHPVGNSDFLELAGVRAASTRQAWNGVG